MLIINLCSQYEPIHCQFIDLHFAADNLCLSSFKFFWWAPKNYFISARVAFQPSKVIQGANRKRICDFLLVRHSNLGPILHRFGAIAGFLCSWPHPYSTLIFGAFPLHQIAHVGVNVSRCLKLLSREIIFEIFQPVWKTYQNVTERHADRQTTYCGITAPCAASRSKNIDARNFLSAVYSFSRNFCFSTNVLDRPSC